MIIYHYHFCFVRVYTEYFVCTIIKTIFCYNYNHIPRTTLLGSSGVNFVFKSVTYKYVISKIVLCMEPSFEVFNHFT